jgi:hypothetical protein
VYRTKTAPATPRTAIRTTNRSQPNEEPGRCTRGGAPTPRVLPRLGGLKGALAPDGGVGFALSGESKREAAPANTSAASSRPARRLQVGLATGAARCALVRCLSGRTTSTTIRAMGMRDPPRTTSMVIEYLPGASGRPCRRPEKRTWLAPRTPRATWTPRISQLDPRTTSTTLAGRSSRKLIVVPRFDLGPREEKRVRDTRACAARASSVSAMGASAAA